MTKLFNAVAVFVQLNIQHVVCNEEKQPKTVVKRKLIKVKDKSDVPPLSQSSVTRQPVSSALCNLSCPLSTQLFYTGIQRLNNLMSALLDIFLALHYYPQKIILRAIKFELYSSLNIYKQAYIDNYRL